MELATLPMREGVDQHMLGAICAGEEPRLNCYISAEKRSVVCEFKQAHK